jgi:hypothetical protein
MEQAFYTDCTTKTKKSLEYPLFTHPHHVASLVGTYRTWSLMTAPTRSASLRARSCLNIRDQVRSAARYGCAGPLSKCEMRLCYAIYRAWCFACGRCCIPACVRVLPTRHLSSIINRRQSDRSTAGDRVDTNSLHFAVSHWYDRLEVGPHLQLHTSRLNHVAERAIPVSTREYEGRQCPADNFRSRQILSPPRAHIR